MLLALLLGQGGSGSVTHDTSGALTGTDATVAGASTRFRAHATSGVLNGQTATVTGASTRSRQFATSGALTGQESTLAGSADRIGAPVTHATSGALVGPGATVAGAADRTRQYATEGTLTGQASTLVGAATRTLLHETTGVLAGADAIIVGSAARVGAAVTHDTSGVLEGPGAIIVGEADPSGTYLRGEGWILQQQRKRKFSEERDEREQLRKAIEAAVDPVTEKVASVVTVKGEVAVVTESKTIPLPVPPQFDAQAVARLAVSVLEAQGIEAQRVRDAENRRRVRIAMEAIKRENERRLRKRRRDEEILLLM